MADRFSKRKLLFITQSVSGVLALILGLLVAFGAVQLWMIYMLALALGLVNAVDNPTRQTFIMEMVGNEELVNAISLNSAQVNLSRVIGPVIGGVLIATMGIASCFIINAISYLAVLVALFMMKPEQLNKTQRAEYVKGQLMEGLRYVIATPVLRDTLIMMVMIGTLSYEFIVSLPLFAQFTFHGNAGSYAALTAAMGIGSVIGGLFSANRRNIDAHLLVKAALLFGLTMLITAVMPTFILAMISLVFVGIFSINFLSLCNVILQMKSSPEMRGRVMALWTVAFLGTTPIGGPIIGWIGQHAGPRWGLATGGCAAISAAGYGLVTLGKERYRKIINK
jgi:MFS family permease